MEWNYPVLRHFLVCQRPPHAVDSAWSDVTMRPVFGLRPRQPYPFLLRELHTFAQVSDARGTFEFAVEMYRSGGHEPLAFAEEEIDFEFDSPMAIFSFVRSFEKLPFPEAGLYEFRLFVRMLRDPSGAFVHGAPRHELAREPLLMEAFQ
jgi:hypothetical protein